MKITNSIGRIAQTLTATAVIPLAAFACTCCESMSPEGADVFDAAAVKPRSAPVQAAPAAAPAPRLDYPASGTVHPSELPSLPVVQPMPIPVPVPRR